MAAWDHLVEDEELMVDEFKSTIRFIEDEYLSHRAQQLLNKAKTGVMTAAERKEYQMLVMALDQRKKQS